MKLAICGASGIGKHHAKWFKHEGAEVVAFLGQSNEKNRLTSKTLTDLMGFNGRSYTAIDTMLSTERPDAVVICTPPETHAFFCKKSLENGSHVLCEKPFVWNDKTIEENLSEARTLMNLAKSKNLVLGVNAQYRKSIPLYHLLMRKSGVPEPSPLSSFYFEIESKGSGNRIIGKSLWTDVAAHPLSMLLEEIPHGIIRTSDIKSTIDDSSVQVMFPYIYDGTTCKVEIIYRVIKEGTPKRKFGFNEFIADYAGFNENNVFRARLSNKNEEVIGQDFMHASIGEFLTAVQGKNSFSNELIYKNLELQTQVYQSLNR